MRGVDAQGTLGTFRRKSAAANKFFVALNANGRARLTTRALNSVHVEIGCTSFRFLNSP
jgi:hypothetical protein